MLYLLRYQNCQSMKIIKMETTLFRVINSHNKMTMNVSIRALYGSIKVLTDKNYRESIWNEKRYCLRLPPTLELVSHNKSKCANTQIPNAISDAKNAVVSTLFSFRVLGISILAVENICKHRQRFHDPRTA